MFSPFYYHQYLLIPLKDILSATDNFSDANFIRGDETKKEYKGQLLQSGQLIDIVARRFHDNNDGQRYKEFWMEISMLSKLKHKNMVSIVGFCDEKREMIVVNKHESRGSLDKFLRDPSLTWMRRLEICVGVARALSYIYYDVGRDFSVIHRDIRSSVILLDDQWEAKLSGFELSITQTAARRSGLCLTNKACGTPGYCDPTYLTSGSVTHKSDMYSFGIVLFEVLCGREATIADEDNMLLAPSVRSHYEKGTLYDMIDTTLRSQMDPQSFKIFSETAYYCLKEQRPQRPNIDRIVLKLEQALVSQREHENPLISNNYSMVDGTTSKNLKGEDLKHLKIPLIDIELATKNFEKTYLIGSGTYGEVYKAELDYFNRKNLLPLEEKNAGELTKKRGTVAVKRIMAREDNQGKEGFLAEIEMLTSCKHPNIVSLLGFCQEGRNMILVYEHASNGSLDDYLGNNGNLTNLTWMQRTKICIDVACGLNYLHNTIDSKQRKIIHRDIKSGNILLGENYEAKIADFGLSKFRPGLSQQVNKTLYTQTLAGTELYLDPEYVKTGRLKNESDIYSFGVVLFEMLSGRFAHDPVYTRENSNGIAAVARRRFNDGTITEMVDPRLMEETHESISTRKRGPDKESLDAFTKIAFQCVAESQADRPTAEIIIKKLEQALYFQENPTDHLRFSLEDIELATQNFSDDNLIDVREFGNVYRGEVIHANGRKTIAAKRLQLDTRSGPQGEHVFLKELQILLEYKHDNIIGLVGYCNEPGEKIIVYEHASRGLLDKFLDDNDLTWRKRLQICIDIASGLYFLHGGGVTQDVVIHRDIKSSNILLNDDWRAKITDFGISLISSVNKDIDFVINREALGTLGYVDPAYIKLGFLTKESDIYSFGVVLFEILCGRLVIVLPDWFKYKYKRGKLDEIVFQGIRGKIAPKSLTTFKKIAFRCVHEYREKRPKIGEVLQQLQKALECQEDYDIWKSKLPKDYENLIQMSNLGENYSTENYKDLYDTFCKGILVQEDKVLFSLGSNGEGNEMISATKFSYKNRWLHKRRSVPESRFHRVAKMSDISNLKIQIKIKPQFLSVGVNYGVHLVFRFCGPRKSLAKRMYVNLKYIYGSETLHTYFATWREDGWMMIELCRFSNHKKDTYFEFLLESFSRCYCGSSAVYVEGIEFRAIENRVPEILVEHEESNSLKEVLKTNLDMDQLFSQNKVDKNKNYMLSAKEALYVSSDVKLLNSKSFRLYDMIELQRQQVLRIKCKIGSHMLSLDTKYACYLVFKLLQKCNGLHCPVIVRDLLQPKNKGTTIIYFRSPSPCNVNGIHRVSNKRKDKWMEVNVCQFNSSSELRDNCGSINLKLISYEGTMSGLIVRSLEFRPM